MKEGDGDCDEEGSADAEGASEREAEGERVAECVAQGEGERAAERVGGADAQPDCVPVAEPLGGRLEGDTVPLREPPPSREAEATLDAEALRDGEEDADAERGALRLAAALRVLAPPGEAEADPDALTAAEGEAVGLPVAVGVFERLATTRTAASAGASGSEGATASVSVSPLPAGSSSAGGRAPAGALSSAEAAHEAGSMRYSAASPIAVPLGGFARLPAASRVGDGEGVAEAPDAPPVPQWPEPSRSSKRMVPLP